MTEDRLQKILARAGVTSRRKAEDLIREGQVTINGQVATLGDKADPAEDAIKVDGKRVHPQTHSTYLLLYKPAGVMSTRADPEGRPTVLELVPEALRKALVPVGRLDFNTEGLLLLTDDGEFAHRVAHPRYGCSKTYEVKVKGGPDPEAVRKLRHGTVLDGKLRVPLAVESMASPGPREGRNTWWTVELGEGKTRQIREMFFRVGHPVQRLRRVAIGPLRDARMGPGDLRELTDREVAALRRATRPDAAKTSRKKRSGKPKGWAKSSKRSSSRKAAGKASSSREGGAKKGPKTAGQKASSQGSPRGGARKGPSSKGSAKGPGKGSAKGSARGPAKGSAKGPAKGRGGPSRSGSRPGSQRGPGKAGRPSGRGKR